jgi:hypothetical protein
MFPYDEFYGVTLRRFLKMVESKTNDEIILNSAQIVSSQNRKWLFEMLDRRQSGSAPWYTTHVCSTVSTTVVSDPLLL